MTTTASSHANVYDTARRLEQDILQKGLVAGARYLTAAEAGRMLGVSTATAHRAMAILARREMLVRRRNSGTFVGARFAGTPQRRIRTLYVILQGATRPRLEYPIDLFVQGIRARLPDVNIQICFLPSNDCLGYLRDLIESARAAGEAVGFVAVSCPREVYRLQADTHLPMVIHGSAYCDQQDIPSLDVDNREAGRLLAEHLIRRGHRRMALLCVTDHLPGDNLFFDGTSEALTAARLPHNALIVRSLPSAPETFAPEIRRLFAGDNAPTAMIARTPALVLAAGTVVEELSGARGTIDMVCYTHLPMPNSAFPYAYVAPRVPFVEMVDRIAQMLDRQKQGLALESKCVVIPVDLQIPGGGQLPRVSQTVQKRRRTRC